jgi:hypothetical protein
VSVNRKEIAGEATWDADRYCAVWTPLVPIVWPIGSSIELKVNPSAIESEKGKMHEISAMTKLYTCAFVEIQLLVICSDFDVRLFFLFDLLQC